MVTEKMCESLHSITRAFLKMSMAISASPKDVTWVTPMHMQGCVHVNWTWSYSLKDMFLYARTRTPV